MQQGLGPSGGRPLNSFKLEADVSLSKDKETIRNERKKRQKGKKSSGTGFVATSCRKSWTDYINKWGIQKWENRVCIPKLKLSARRAANRQSHTKQQLANSKEGFTAGKHVGSECANKQTQIVAHNPTDTPLQGADRVSPFGPHLQLSRDDWMHTYRTEQRGLPMCSYIRPSCSAQAYTKT